MSKTPEQLNDRRKKVLNEIGELKRNLQQKNDELKEINDKLGIIPKERNTKRKRDELEEQQVNGKIETPKEKRSKTIVEELFRKVKEGMNETTIKQDNSNEEDKAEEEENSIENGAKKY